MRIDRLRSQASWGLSLVLGQASVLLGLMLALGWTLAFALLLPSHSSGWAGAPRLMLPYQPPLIGFLLGAVGLISGQFSRERIWGYALAGMIINAFPLTLSLALLWIKVTH